MSTNFIITAPHVDELHDTDLDAILDTRLFDHDAWCSHPCIITPDHTMMGCAVCGYFEVLQGQPCSLVAPHVRNVPHYLKDMGAAWQIIEAMNGRDVQTRMRFELRLNVLYHCRIFNLTPRLIAVAALQALDIVDGRGYLKVHEVEA